MRPLDGTGPGEHLTVGIDVGTTNTKVALVATGPSAVQMRTVASAPTPEPYALKPLLLALLRRVLAGSPPPEAVGIASMAETGVPLDGAGKPLGPWLRWDSHQAGREAVDLSRRLGWKHLVQATGVRPSAKVPLAAWAWMRANRPDEWSAMAAWAGAADLVCLFLTGRLATDHTLAGRTMAYRLPPAGVPLPDTFDPELLAEVRLRPEQLPAVVPPGQVAGRVRDPAFVSCGLGEETPVVLAGHDHAVGAYACGVRGPGDIADSLGTAEAVMSVVAGLPDPVEVAKSGMSTVVTVSGQHRAILAGSASAGATVGWWLDHESGGLPPEELFDLVLAADDRPSDVTVLPYLFGRQAPAPDPAARLRVLGRRPQHTSAELARAMLEGLCLQTRWMLQEQARLARPEAGTKPMFTGSADPASAVSTGSAQCGCPTGSADPASAVVTVFGGAVAANPAWVRIKAHVLPWAMQRVTTAEPVAAGAALLAAVRCAQVGPAPPTLDRRAGPSVPGAGVDYDHSFARFVAAATETERRPQRCPGPQGDDLT